MDRTTAPTTRLIKKIDPGRPGARRWSVPYGDALVYMRYRVDPARGERQMTVEIVVDRAPLLTSINVRLRVVGEELAVRRASSKPVAHGVPAAV